METKNPLAHLAPYAVLTLGASQLNLKDWEAERWDDGTTAFYPVNFSRRGVGVLRNLAVITGLSRSEACNDSIYIVIPDNLEEYVVLQFIDPSSGLPDLELHLPMVSPEARKEILALHAPALLHARADQHYALTGTWGTHHPPLVSLGSTSCR